MNFTNPTIQENFDRLYGHLLLSGKDAAYSVFENAWLLAVRDCVKRCEAIETDQWALYKGRPPYDGTEEGRADNYVQGKSDGAGMCAEALRSQLK
jgi:hypothetical protein